MAGRYGLKPSVLRGDNFARLGHLFGFQRGRLIYKFPDGWESQVKEFLDEFPGSRRALAEEVLRELQRSGIPVKEEFHSKESWEENVLRVSTELKLRIDAVVTDRATREKEITPHEFEWESLKHPQGGALRVANTPEAYLHILEDLFVISPVIHIYDKYWSFRNEYGEPMRNVWRFAVSLINLAEACGVRELTFHFVKSFDSRKRVNWDYDSIKRDLEEVKKQAKQSNVAPRIKLHDYKKATFHERAVFGRDYGYFFDRGFNFNSKDGTTALVDTISSAALDGLFRSFAYSSVSR